jgi:hypothetical protein
LRAIDRIKERVSDIGWLLLLALAAAPAALTPRGAKWQTPGGNDGGSMTGFRSLPYLKKILAERDELLRQRDIALGDRNEFLRQRNAALIERDKLLRQRDIALGEHNELLRQRNPGA